MTWATLRASVRAFLIAVGGVALALAYYSSFRWAAIVISVLAVVFIGTAFWIGTQLLPESPVAAVRWMDSWLLGQMIAAAVAAAAVIVIGIELATLGMDEDPGQQEVNKQLVAALTTGVTTFLTAAFISWGKESGNAALNDSIEASFKEKYQGRFASNSRAERLVYSDPFDGISGWGPSARRTRAERIAVEIANGA